MDPSHILDVPKDADKGNYRKSLPQDDAQISPDKAGDNSKIKFQRVGLVYEILMAKTD